MKNVAYSTAVDFLLKQIPELRHKYENEVNYWSPEQPPSHVVYGDLFCKFVRDARSSLTERNKQEVVSLLTRCFQLIEELARSKDFETQCIVKATVLESLLGDSDIDWQSFSPYFGVATRKMAQDLINEWS